DVKELKDVDNSLKVISTIKSEVPNAVKEYLGSSLDDALHKVIQKNFANIIKEHSVLAETVKRLRQQYAPQKGVEEIREIKIEHARKQQKRKLDDANNDEGPSVGSERGLKRQKTSKDTETSKKSKSTESSKGTSKSQPKSTSKPAQAEETMFEAEDT
nr:hypothetical protein [Tanacetum cinerariifolium]